MTTKTAEKLKTEQASDTPICNTRIWDALGKTDPRHTKNFNRAGGFKGTAIKPIWVALRMTEHFGPCGIGWGMDKPEHQTLFAKDEGLVFCTTGLWYIDPATGQRGQVYGVGGDKFLVSQSSGLRTSDEAFKAAYTDALSNAMKQIGVSADVHMGLFEDTKYVNGVRGEFEADEPPAAVTAKPPEETAEQKERRASADLIRDAIAGAETVRSLDAIMALHTGTLEGFKTGFPAAYNFLTDSAVKKQDELKKKEQA